MQLSTCVSLEEEEESEIAAILGCKVPELNDKLSQLVQAALQEYLTMLRGQKVLKRGSDILEYRLFLLIKHVFDETIPDEQLVSNLFQTTLTESRSLIRAVISKYQYQLRTAIENTLKNSLSTATQAGMGEKYEVVINSRNTIDGLNRHLALLDGSLNSITKKYGSVSTYEISPESYNKLKTRLGF